MPRVDAEARMAKVGALGSIDAIAARPRWTAEDATKVLEAAAASGLPLAKFAEQRGLAPQRLSRWRRRLGRPSGAPPERMRFEELVVHGANGEVGERDRLELVLRSGHVVRLGSEFDADALRRLLGVLEAC